ncbi:efflux transporter outer membrane subunit [Klebsiella oxytoca]|uniref:efflux transporter outer membrane subunit n=1 Tax=Klebsiella oxytoca TaxID=571 RepID=UPI00357135C4
MILNKKSLINHTKITFLTLIFLSGCASSDGLHTKNSIIEPNELKSDSSLKTVKLSAANWPQKMWWKSFNDPQMTFLIEEGLSSSPSMQEANARAEKANAQILSTGADRLPDVNAEASITRSRLAKADDPLLVGKTYSTLRTASLGMSYELDLWGGKKAEWESAVGAAKAAEIDKQAAQLTLAANIARAWINLNLAWELLDVAKQNAQRTHHIAEIQNNFYREGLTAEYQYKQAAANDKDAETKKIAAEQHVTNAGIKLSILLGKGPDTWKSLHPVKFNIPKDITLPSTIPAELLGHRPDIVAARWRVEAASKHIESVKTEFYPNINLVAQAGSRNLLDDAFFGAPSRFFNVGPTLSLPIFDGGKRRADLTISNAQWDESVAHYNNLVISSLGELSTTIIDMQYLQKQLDNAEASDELVRSAWKDISQQYRVGIRPWMDVLSLQDQLLESQETVFRLKADILNHSVSLIEQLGGGVI